MILDQVDFSAFATSLWVELENGSVTEYDWHWTAWIAGGMSSIENFLAGSGDDYLLGNNKGNLLDGGAGEDLIDGGAGDDILDGAAGNDLIYSGSGYNILYGGMGMDAAYIAHGSFYDVPLNDIENLIFLPPPLSPWIQRRLLNLL